MFNHKTRVFNLKKVQKNNIFSTLALQHIFNKN